MALNNPSKIAELQELEHWKQKFDIAASATEGYFSRRWVSEHVFSMSHEEFVRNQRELYYDRKQDAALQAVAEAAAGGEMGGGLGTAPIGGEELGGELDLGADTEVGGPTEMPAGAAGAPTPEAEGGGEESSLLAVPPGSRKTPTPRSQTPTNRHHYYPKTVDRRPARRPKSFIFSTRAPTKR